ncbi:MAG: aminotransferase class V-fold PLP-dependent enzyme [Ignavibacteria bacterium]|nr:aminotransferase class V-fold PLP-dependent enzyme [Ignavibacteria bacterium]
MTDIQKEFEHIKTCEDARKLFPVTKHCTYLDNAHYSHYSSETRRRLIEAVDGFTFTNENLSLINYQTAERLRKKCGELIHAKPEDIFLTSSTTHGLNVFANGIDLNAGDTVIFADSEFPAVPYPWMNQEKMRGIKYEMIPSDKGKIKISDIEATIKRTNAKVLTISSVEFLGFRNDLKTISKICRDNGCYLVVDAIQAVGACPTYVDEYNVDFLSAGSQKWMMSPSGVGFAYIPANIREKVKPSYVATTSINYDFKNFLNYNLNFRGDAVVYENSTLNCLGMIGMECAVELFLKIGVENIFNHILKLQDIFIGEVEGSNFSIECDLSAVHRSNILIFSHKDSSKNEKIQKDLEQKKIYVALREGYLRLSAHLFNNEEDILKLTAALKDY